jgi:hypothetical protein
VRVDPVGMDAIALTVALAHAQFVGFNYGFDYNRRIRVPATDTYVLRAWTIARERGKVALGTYMSFKAGWRFAEDAGGGQ